MRILRPSVDRLLALLLALVLAACGTTPPSPTPTAPSTAASESPTTPPASSTPTPPDPATVYAGIERQVEDIRQLRPKGTDVAPVLLDAAGVRAIVEKELSQPASKAQLAANERLFKALGMLPATASLENLEAELLSSQVAGLYDPETKKLYVVSKAGSVGPVEKVTFSHEFTHELQDQNFGLNGLAVDKIGEGDRDLGRLALVEGDATATMSIWEQKYITPGELGQLAAQALDPKALATLAAMPPILRQTLLFPYTGGLAFVSSLRASGGWQAVDAAFAAPPDSTEQILHPEKYASHEKPVAVSVPANLPARLGPGWKSSVEDTLGELQLRIWLQGAVASTQASDAAAGWGGDRVEVLTGPGDSWGLALATAWDTPADASQFEAAAQAEVGKLPFATLVPAGQGLGSGPTVLAASDAATLAKLESAVAAG